MASADTPTEEEALRPGRCKWFNIVKGYGFITPDDGGPDVFVHQTAIRMQGFRSLGEGEEILFESRTSGKGVEATIVCGVAGGDCRGSERRPVSRKKFRKIRCYNCGDFANHIAAKCPHGPLPKRCHGCKSSDHLIADCPSRKPGDSGSNRSSNSSGSSGESIAGSPSHSAAEESEASPPAALTPGRHQGFGSSPSSSSQQPGSGKS